jgi:hypothetical protein
VGRINMLLPECECKIPTKTQAVRCPVCKLDCGPADYGDLEVVPTPWHFARGVEYTAMAAEGPHDEYYGEQPCSGSEQLGRVVPY